jgi:hypothetical protein
MTSGLGLGKLRHFSQHIALGCWLNILYQTAWFFFPNNVLITLLGISHLVPFFFNCSAGGTLWHLQKFLHCIKYIRPFSAILAHQLFHMFMMKNLLNLCFSLWSDAVLNYIHEQILYLRLRNHQNTAVGCWFPE